ncbi:MAG: glycosyltransferase family 4 protein [Candidatus Eisenbacteria bacterium]|nr:glycosyltransferase family 4 protein [Candidatus Eisenbacteria bacterium]
MRIVIVKPIMPWPATQGTRRVTVGLLRALSTSHDVTLVAPALDRDDLGSAKELERKFGIRVITTLAPNRRSIAHRAFYRAAFHLESLLAGHSPRALYATPRALIDRAGREAGAGPFDLAIFEYWYTYRAFDRIPARRRVLLAHDADFEIAASRRSTGMFDDNERRREAEACRSVDEVWTLTSADRAALSQLSGIDIERIQVVPFGVDSDALDLPAGADSETILFFGAYQADFNVDALHYLLDEIWPLIRRARPGARLEVAGGGLAPDLARQVRSAGGIVIGPVDDLSELFRRATVVIIPLRFGGGLRIRLLEALAARRAVVATPTGIGGLAGHDGEHWLLGRNAAELARAAVRLLSEPELVRRLGESGRTLIEAQYSQTRADAQVQSLVQRFI